jgi:hypothetical protein
VFTDGEIVACVVMSHGITDNAGPRRRGTTPGREPCPARVPGAPGGVGAGGHRRSARPEHRYELANPYRAMTKRADRPIIGRTIIEAIPTCRPAACP